MRTNGLSAEHYGEVCEVRPEHSADVLLALRDAGVAAYVTRPADGPGPGLVHADRSAIEEARRIVRSVVDDCPVVDDDAWASIVAAFAEETTEPRRPGPEYDGTDDGPGGSGAERTDRNPPGADPHRQPWQGHTAPRWHPARRPRHVDPDAWPGLGASDSPPADARRGESDDDGDHFVPADPPPVPKGDWISRLAWGGMIGGPVLLIASTLLMWPLPRDLTVVCVLAFVGGMLTLVWRMKDPPGDGHGPDDGAVL